jgi:hypothetical protein
MPPSHSAPSTNGVTEISRVIHTTHNKKELVPDNGGQRYIDGCAQAALCVGEVHGEKCRHCRIAQIGNRDRIYEIMGSFLFVMKFQLVETRRDRSDGTWITETESNSVIHKFGRHTPRTPTAPPPSTRPRVGRGLTRPPTPRPALSTANRDGALGVGLQHHVMEKERAEARWLSEDGARVDVLFLI